jgi:lysophospholipase L1-like esterase
MRKIHKLLFIITVILMSCKNNNELIIPFSNSEIAFSGRIDFSQEEAAEIYWSGSSIKINFEGESIEALLKDESGDNYYNVILDNDSISILRPTKVKQYHQLASGLSKGKHTVELFKRAEWDRGKTSFYGFKINSGAKLLSKSAPKNRKIEFYGNSITAGFAIEDFSGKDSPDSTYTNNYLSYAAITARHYDAKYKCICRSGIGITVSWVPQIMPEIYDRLNPLDPNSKWDLSADEPDIVVVNLFQNDTWLVNLPEHEEFKKRFGDTPPTEEEIINAYQQFITNLRNNYPKANIICTLGSMDAAKQGSKWMEYIKLAVANLNDKKIQTHFMPYLKSGGHPTIKDQEIMAKNLIEFIDQNIEW